MEGGWGVYGIQFIITSLRCFWELQVVGLVGLGRLGLEAFMP